MAETKVASILSQYHIVLFTLICVKIHLFLEGQPEAYLPLESHPHLLFTSSGLVYAFKWVLKMCQKPNDYVSGAWKAKDHCALQMEVHFS